MPGEEVEKVFEEPEEVPATVTAESATTASAAPSLEGVVEAVEEALRRLDAALRLRDVLCRGHEYECILEEGVLVCGPSEELEALARQVRRFARLAGLIYELYRRGMLPSDVRVYILRRGEPAILANAVVVGLNAAGAVPVYTSFGQHDLYYVFELSGNDAVVVYLGFDADWRLEGTAVYMGPKVAQVIREQIIEVLRRSCINAEPGDAGALAYALRLARKLSQL